MNFFARQIKAVLDNVEKHFEKDGKYSRYYPVYEATRTFFFIPGNTTKGTLHVRDSLDLKRLMSFVIIALVPHFLFGVYNAGYHARLAAGLSTDFMPVAGKGLMLVMPLVIVSYAVGLFWEGLFAMIRRHNISEGFLVTGLLYPLVLPPDIPLWQAAAGISFGVVICKEVFGGTGRNLVNPALAARAFVFFSYPLSITGDNVWIALKDGAEKLPDAISGATALAVSAAVTVPSSVEEKLVEAGFTFKNLFLGLHPGCIGETSVLLCIAGGLFLCITGIASYRIMAGGVIGVLGTGYILNLVSGPESLPYLSMNPFYHLVMGGFAFGIVYMATDPVTAPGMNASRWLYGILIGVLTVVVRVLNPAYPDGVMLAILFMNLFAPLLDFLEIKIKLRKRIPNV